MGTIVHTAVIVTMPANEIAAVHGLAVAKFGDLATPMVPARRNNLASFAVLPCGSKLNWEAEIDHRAAIQAFLAEADLSWNQFAVVAFGECESWAGKELPTSGDLNL